MIVIISYTDSDDETHGVTEDLGTALLEYWAALQADANTPIPDALLVTLTEAGIDVRWGFVVSISITQDFDSGQTTMDTAVFGISTVPNQDPPTAPIDADSRRKTGPGAATG